MKNVTKKIKISAVETVMHCNIRATPKCINNYKQYKTLFEFLKKKSKENYYSDLMDSYKYNIKTTWDIMKEIIGNKRVTNAPLPNFITVKNRNIRRKRNCGNI